MVNPTGYTALDMIGFTDQGTYSSSDNYVKNDLVHYSGNIWRCLIDDTTGIAPAEGVNWTLFIGEPTNLVERIIAPVETDPATNAWAVGRQIIYNDNLYEVITAITAGDSLVTYEDDPTNANIKLADPVETQLLNLKGNVSNKNLLDNAWFTVNQRGQSSYTGLGYTYDRWYHSSSDCVTARSNGVITLSHSTADWGVLIQRVEDDVISSLRGKDLTLSIMMANGEIKSITKQFPSSNPSQSEDYYNLQISDDALLLFRYDIGGFWDVRVALTPTANTSVSFKAVKLELGSVSTLAMDTAPNYATELLKCQRYYYQCGTSTGNFYHGIAQAVSQTQAVFNMICPSPFRAGPTITLTQVKLTKDGNATAATSTSASIYRTAPNSNNMQITFITSGLTVGDNYLVRTESAVIELSADL